MIEKSWQILDLSWKFLVALCLSFLPMHSISILLFLSVIAATSHFQYSNASEYQEIVNNIRPCETGWICFGKPPYTSIIGIWYEPWWESAGSHARQWTERSRFKPVLGFYSSDSEPILSKHFAELTCAGIDYLLVDDTNLVIANQYDIDKNIRALFAWAEKSPQDNHLQIAIVIGGELWMVHSLDAQKNAADYVFRDFAKSPTYFRWQGKPLLIVYNAYDSPDVFAPEWDDPRFTVRIATGVVEADNPNEQRYAARGWWGWVHVYPQPINSEVVGISPGADNQHQHCSGCTGHLDRASGQLFMKEWLRAIKTNPGTIVISSWNEFSDETAIEPAVALPGAPAWNDSYGTETPDWYLQITTAYAALRRGLLPGVTYQDEDDDSVYTVVDGTLVPQTVLPHGRPVILLPAGTLKGLGLKLPVGAP